jgi:DNA-binding NtrC family response regulator
VASSDHDRTDVVERPLPEGAESHGPTDTVQLPAHGGDGQTRTRFRVEVIDGAQARTTFTPAGERFSIGSHALNDIVIDGDAVSRFHCEVHLEPRGARLVDLKSRNGTVVDGLRANDVYLRPGSVVQIGPVRLRFDAIGSASQLPVSPNGRFGGLVGSSRTMRQSIALLEAAARSEATVLLLGETGTGKGRAAEAVHKASDRKNGPFITVDCGAIPTNLLESELFGHEKGAFTGAEARRVGAFEEASGGTLFLDEIGELPLDLQPKLLRALENREIRRVGANRHIPVSLRVIAATNRDLRVEVNAGDFRADLYYRLAVLTIPLPSLRERPEDIPAIVDELLGALRAPAAAAAVVRSREALAELQRGHWPGNVRELRNHLEARLVLASVGPAAAADAPSSTEPAPPAGFPTPFVEARKQALDQFERGYLETLMRAYAKVAPAAQAAGIDRVYLYRLLNRHGMKLPG